RVTVERVYERILDDLTEAADLFGTESRVTTDFRINRPTVEILLSRVYLYTGKWKEAVESATEAIRIGGKLADLTAIEKNGAFACVRYSSPEVTWMYGGEGMGFYVENGLNMAKELEEGYGA